MSTGQNASKRHSKDWWGKRPLANTPVSIRTGMKFWKRLLHKRERHMGKALINKN